MIPASGKAIVALLGLGAMVLSGCAGVRAPAEDAPGLATTPVPLPEGGGEEEVGPPTVPLVVSWRFSMRHFDLFPFAPMEFASPVVSGDRVIAASSRAQSVYALDRSTGRTRWTYRTRGRVVATPAVGGGRVYVADAEGKLHGIEDRQGVGLWKADLGGIAHSKVLYDPEGAVERVIAVTGYDRVHAVNAVNGEEIWTYRRDAPPDLTIYGTSTAVKASVGGKTAYLVGFSNGSFVAIDASNGTPIWETRLKTTGRFRDVDGSALVSGNRVYVTAYADALYALELETGKAVWDEAPGGATGVIEAGGRLFHGTDDGSVVARDPADGRELWRWEVPAGVPTTPVAGGDFLFLASSSRTFHALRQDTGSLAWTFEPDFRVSGSWAAPTVGGDSVFFTSNVGTVFAFKPAGPGSHYIGTWESGSRRP